jgi:hypothetical protein
MRLHFGSPPQDGDFQPELDGWTKLREPDPILLQIIAAPVAVLNVAILVPAWGWLASVLAPPDQRSTSAASGEASIIDGSLLSLFGVLAGIPLLIAVHELLHAICYPGGLRTNQTTVGVWPARLLFYATYLGPMSRNRYLWVYACPFVVLTLLPLIAAAVLRAAPVALAAVSILNGFFACGDQTCMAMLAWQIPSIAIVRNRGWETWWKLPASTTVAGGAETTHE